MKTPILATLAASLAIVTVLTALPAQTRPQPAVASEKELIQSDPYRPSYDMWGNKWSYDGKLIKAACPNVPDPITGKANPECVCPADTSEGAYYQQGNDKETGAAICRLSYYNECPYATAQPANGPVCEKLKQQQEAVNKSVQGNFGK